MCPQKIGTIFSKTRLSSLAMAYQDSKVSPISAAEALAISSADFSVQCYQC